MDPKHTMAKDFRDMSTMIPNMKLADNNSSDDQQILANIQLLPDSSETLKLAVTHNWKSKLQWYLVSS